MREMEGVGIQRRRKYDPEFKRNAVLMTEETGRTVKEVARDLGISADLLYRWRVSYRERKELAFPGNGKEALTPEEARVRELEKRLRELELERDILKKAVAIFSRASR